MKEAANSVLAKGIEIKNVNISRRKWLKTLINVGYVKSSDEVKKLNIQTKVITLLY